MSCHVSKRTVLSVRVGPAAESVQRHGCRIILPRQAVPRFTSEHVSTGALPLPRTSPADRYLPSTAVHSTPAAGPGHRHTGTPGRRADTPERTDRGGGPPPERTEVTASGCVPPGTSRLCAGTVHRAPHAGRRRPRCTVCRGPSQSPLSAGGDSWGCREAS